MPLFKEIMTWVLECAIVIAIAYALVSSFGFRTTVVGNAMQDTLQSEEQIFVNRFVYMVRAPKQGDVVVFCRMEMKIPLLCPEGHCLSGGYGTDQNGKVYINGELYKEDIVSASIEDPGVAADEVKLGDDEYFVLGDNRNSSEDSRMANIGNVKKDYIIGKAWFHFKGFGKMGLID